MAYTVNIVSSRSKDANYGSANVKTYTHTERTTEVAQGNPGAGISGVIHIMCESYV